MQDPGETETGKLNTSHLKNCLLALALLLLTSAYTLQRLQETAVYRHQAFQAFVRGQPQ